MLKPSKFEIKQLKAIYSNLLDVKTPTEYQKGVILLLKACIKDVDPNYSDTDEQFNDIRQAGLLIYKSHKEHGTIPLNDDGIWAYIPKCLQRLVDVAWDGIGGWEG